MDMLTQGLLAGYAGKSQRTSVSRGSFVLKTSHLENEDGFYHDEWTTASRIGGGQEIATSHSGTITRLYAGGVVNSEVLTSLGITPKDVTNFLKKEIQKLGDKTRLFENCTARDGEWLYSYQIMDRYENIPVWQATEIIFYRSLVVFVHYFLLCPVG